MGEKRTKRQSNLRSVRLFEFLSDETICRITDVLEMQEFEKSQRIFKKGDLGRAMYFLLHGTCVERNFEDDEGPATQQRVHEPGDFFGEACFAGELKRPSDMVALEAVRVHVLR